MVTRNEWIRAGLNEYDYDDMRAEELAERRYRNALSRHPDCRDPDHPGCECCEESDTEDDQPTDEEDECET